MSNELIDVNNSIEQFQKEKIIQLVEIKNVIESIHHFGIYQHELQDESLKKILNNIQTYISNNCNHKWINDSIDIDLDTSMNITFCEICSMTQ